ncbi:hypothetical protein ACLOEU_09870 [Limosilactobacillus fermentum]|uniref:hypothetical protein n=9 Tax=Lactobacillaceae TaxID=33958 RepID=UPI003EBFF78C
MDTTATLNLQPVTKTEQAHIVRHNARENENYENKDIDITKSHENVVIKYHDEQELLNDQYKDYIDSRNAKLERDFDENKISLEQYTARKQTVKEYLNGSNGSKQKKAYTDIVATVGNVEMIDDFKKVIPPSRWNEFFTKVYDRTARRIDRLDGFSVINMHVHFDEAGMPHGHIDTVNRGTTAKGKPSTTLNSALKKSYGYKDSRRNLKELRDNLDDKMVEDCNVVLNNMHINTRMQLVRLDAVGGLSMEEYKEQKKKEQELKERKQELDVEQDELEKQKLEQQKQQKLIELKQREQAEREAEQNEREDTLTNIRNHVQEQFNSIKHFVKRTVSFFGLDEKFQNSVANEWMEYPVPREKGGFTKEKYTGGDWALTAIHENPKRFTANVVRDLTTPTPTQNKKKEKDDDLER